MNLNVIAANFIEQYGLISIFLIVMLEYANFPLPSEIVLPLVGVMIAKGNVSFIVALVVSIIGGLVGSIINYIIGLYFGKPVLKCIANKYPKMQKSVSSSMWWLDRYGKLSVMLARVVPVARTVISIPAGMGRMKLSVFTFYSCIGIAVWNTVLIYLGYILGDNLAHITYVMKNYSLIVVLVIGIALIGYYIKRSKKAR